MSERYIRPDYSESICPSEDDDLDEISDDEIEIEKILDEQEEDDELPMSSNSNPFSDYSSNRGTSLWGNHNNDNTKPWETKENNNNSIWGSPGPQRQQNSWGS